MIKRRQLKWSMIAMLAVCWFIPLMILSVTVFFIVEANINKQLKNTIVTSADRVVEICQMKIDDVIVASKASSYISTIKKSYAEYLKDGNEYELNQEVTLFMSQQYRYNTNLNLTALYFTSDPEDIYY